MMFLGDNDEVAISMSDDSLAIVVDEILKSTDIDNDGLITYAEFKTKHYT